ncbi:THUMP domain-containing protein 1 [Coelomomyces lativittatus]|nr:THUMP domain-containing protein 1 [Coelomomyces lativittatus]
MAGFLVSATINQEKRAASFILHRLMDILETHYSELLNTHFPSSSSSSSSSSTSNETTSSLVTKEDVTSHLDIEKEIAEEIQEHQSQVTTDAPFRLIPRLSNCLFFIELHPTLIPHVDPIDFIPYLFQDSYSTRSTCPFIHRVLPFSTICRTELETIEKNVQDLITKLPKEEVAPFRIELHARFNSQCNKEEIVAKVASLFIERGHKVDLNHHEVTVLIEIIHHFVGISILRQGVFRKFQKLNLQEWITKKIEEKNSTEKETQSKETLSSTPTTLVCMNLEENSETLENNVENESEESNSAETKIEDPLLTLPTENSKMNLQSNETLELQKETNSTSSSIPVNDIQVSESISPSLA